jgi:tetratricopeptide (TPR) repeat protein
MRYAAFISYSSLDRASGEALQKALEAFVLPARLRGQDFGRGPVPKRIGPVFRDRWDADASADLGAELREALHASDALIVLCSPASARSFWVGEEVREFKRSDRAGRIYPVLVDGLPLRHDAEGAAQGAFHPALFERWDAAQGTWQPDLREPLAPDLRAEGDGLRFTVLKLVAALTAVPLTTLTQRQAEAERRERNLARWIAGVMATLAIAATAGAWFSWQAGTVARQRLETAVEMAARRVDDAAGFQDRYGVPSDVIHELLDGARKDFDELTSDAPDTPTLALQRGRLDRLFAHLYDTVGDGAQHKAMADRALDTLARVPTERRLAQPGTWLARLPDAQRVAIERLQALSAQAQAAAARGDAPAARSALERMAGQADALRAQADSPPLRSLAGQARAQRARLVYESGELEPALAWLREAIRILDTGAAPGDAGSGPAADAGEVATLRSEEAEMLLELGRHAEALRVQEGVVESLLPTPGAGAAPPDRLRSLATAVARRGDMRLAATRDLSGAREDYLAARAMLADLQAQDSARTDLKRDLSLAHERVGDAFLQAGDLAVAQEAFAACLALRRELAARNRANAEWRRDLSVALERMADVQMLRRRPREAEAAFAEALALRQAAHDAAPADAVATRDLAVLWMRLGQARTRAKAPLADIDPAYARAIELMQPLVGRAAAESRWRRDLAVAHAERGEARRQAGRPGDARADFRAALELVQALRGTAPEDAQLAQDEAWLREKLKR